MIAGSDRSQGRSRHIGLATTHADLRRAVVLGTAVPYQSHDARRGQGKPLQRELEARCDPSAEIEQACCDLAVIAAYALLEWTSLDRACLRLGLAARAAVLMSEQTSISQIASLARLKIAANLTICCFGGLVRCAHWLMRLVYEVVHASKRHEAIRNRRVEYSARPYSTRTKEELIDADIYHECRLARDQNGIRPSHQVWLASQARHLKVESSNEPRASCEKATRTANTLSPLRVTLHISYFYMHTYSSQPCSKPPAGLKMWRKV